MLSDDEAAGLRGARAVDVHGERLGRVLDVYLDDGTGAPLWVALAVGRLAARRCLAPLADADVVDGVLRLPYPRSLVRAAPRPADDGHLAPADEDELRAHYGAG